MVTTAILGLVQTAASVTLVSTLSMGAIAVMGVVSLFSLVVTVWGLILSILYGKNCNKKLFEQVKGNAEQVPKQRKGPIVLAAVMIVWGILLSIVLAVGTAMAEDTWSDDTFPEDEWSSIPEMSDTALPSDNIASLSQLPQIAAEDMALYTNLSADNAAVMSYPIFDSAHLNGDVTVTMGTLFQTLFDSFSWDTSGMEEYAAQGTLCDVICEWNGNQPCLSFFEVYGDMRIREGVLTTSDGNVQTLSQQDIANLMAAMCDAYHEQTGTEAYSPAIDILGMWYDADQDFAMEVTANTIAGHDYSIGGVSESSVWIIVEMEDNMYPTQKLTLDGESMDMYAIQKYGPESLYWEGDEIFLGTFEEIA